MNLANWLLRSATLSPDAPAVLSGDAVVSSYARFADRASRIATALRSNGIGVGDRVAIFMANHPLYLDLWWGAWWAGAVVVPINAKLHPKEAAFVLQDSGAKLVASEVEGLGVPTLGHDAIDALATAEPMLRPEPLADDALAWLFYTSGTTGRPKGVMLTCGNLVAMSLTYLADVDEVRATDAALYAAPLSHGAGCYAPVHVLRGARHVIPRSGGFDPAEILQLAATLGDIHMFAAPTMVRRLIAHAAAARHDGNGIRTIVYGGGPMYVADIERAVSQFGPRFVQIYGQGESPMTITALPRNLVADRTHPRWRERLGSVGFAQSSVDVAVVGPDGAPLPVGETGEVVVRGPSVMAGYWRNEEATAATLKDGWLWTGDMGVMDEDGFLTLKDRSKDVIISGGTNVYPREVEEVLLRHPSVAEVAVVGRPHEDWGEEVVAFVVPADGCRIEPEALDALCRDEIARFKRPKAYEPVASLPKNNYGKVLKTELRERFGGG
ncbi:acyl-CoA synthetase [Acuticoccus sp.]|uniref:acyl-CoA synthetase n=1 Tax=Acuticoccus sp. TaxID=1904378 RepID=UPI003B52B4ED